VHQIETSAIPLKVLEAVRQLREYLDQVESVSLCDARDVGAAITDIAEALGTTRQTVYNRLRQLQAEKQAREPADDVIVVDVEPEPQA
jgi:transposase-like protein